MRKELLTNLSSEVGALVNSSSPDDILTYLRNRDALRKQFRQQVRTSDPLEFDLVISNLHQADESGNTDQIKVIAYQCLNQTSGLDLDDLAVSHAVLRDFEFVVGVGVRHGMMPVDINDALPEVLEKAADTTGTVRRGSISSYTLFNPQDDRMRTYTANPRERMLIMNIATGSESQDFATECLFVANSLDLCKDPKSAGSLIEETAEGIRPMTKSVTQTIEQVGARFFTMDLSQYMHNAEVSGIKVGGPSPAHLPQLVIDHMLFGWDIYPANQTYSGYMDMRREYLQPDMRELLSSFEGPSLVTKLREINVDSTDLEHMRLLQATRQVLLECRKFRFPHKKLANDAAAVKSKTLPPAEKDVLLLLQNEVSELYRDFK